MSAEQNSNRLAQLKEDLDNLVNSLQHPQEKRIGYGNLRREYSEWTTNDGETTNVAVIYETPGGSTAQVNVTYGHSNEKFAFLDQGLESRVITDDVNKVMEHIRSEVERIPEKRWATLRGQIDRWFAEGKHRSAVFGELNKLLQSEFLGGRITIDELKRALRYAVAASKNEEG
ncbi:MAG: hypothetical protein ACE5O2_03880 [Armatimonadota bacterium]